MQSPLQTPTFTKNLSSHLHVVHGPEEDSGIDYVSGTVADDPCMRREPARNATNITVSFIEIN
jgi:hypothetical protein